MNYEESPFFIADRTSTRARNTSRFGDENCTIWYHPQTGEVIGVGPEIPKRGEKLQSVLLRCDDIGVLPEIYCQGRKVEVTPVISLVLDQARKYREFLEHIVRVE